MSVYPGLVRRVSLVSKVGHGVSIAMNVMSRPSPHPDGPDTMAVDAATSSGVSMYIPSPARRGRFRNDAVDIPAGERIARLVTR